MEGEERGRARAEEDRNEPGIGRALLVVVAMIGITAVLCVLIYGMMVAIRPIEARQGARSSAVELQVLPGSRHG